MTRKNVLLKTQVLISIGLFLLFLCPFIRFSGTITTNFSLIWNNKFHLVFYLLIFTISILIPYYFTKGTIVLFKFITNPFKEMITKLKASKASEDVQKIVNKLASKVGITPPKMFVSNEINNPFVFGLDKENSILFVSNKTLSDNDKEEIDNVLLHELYHISTDVDEYSHIVIFESTFVFRTLFLDLALLIAMVMEYNLFGYFPMGTLGTKLFLVMTYITLAYLILLVLIVMYTYIKIGNLFPKKYTYIRELFADSFASITTQNPSKLSSAIKKGYRRSFFSRNTKSKKFEKLCFVPNLKKSKTSTPLSMATIFSPKVPSFFFQLVLAITNPLELKVQKCCPLSHRLELQKMIDKLLNEGVYIKRLTSNFKKISRYDLEVTPLAIACMLKKNPDILQKLEHYIINDKKLNLFDLAKYLSVDLMDAFLTLVAAVFYKMIDINIA